MSETSEFGAEYLQSRLDREFVLARHIGIIVDTADDTGVVLRAPLALNANFKGTAFGGSLYSLAVLCGWAWLTRYLAAHSCPADAVIQHSSMRFLAPVTGELCACTVAPSVAQIDRFRRMLERAGRGRIGLRVNMRQHGAVATLFDGVYAAALRQGN
jgi:thioesterase domain-containing protein